MKLRLLLEILAVFLTGLAWYWLFILLSCF